MTQDRLLRVILEPLSGGLQRALVLFVPWRFGRQELKNLLNDRGLESTLASSDPRRQSNRYRRVAHLDDAVPSEREHQVLMELVTDVVSTREVVDRLQVREIVWERDDSSAVADRTVEQRGSGEED